MDKLGGFCILWPSTKPHPMNEIINRLTSMEIEQLGEIAAKMFEDQTDHGGIILDAALTVLD